MRSANAAATALEGLRCLAITDGDVLEETENQLVGKTGSGRLQPRAIVQVSSRDGPRVSGRLGGASVCRPACS